MSAMTEKQAAFRAELIERRLADTARNFEASPLPVRDYILDCFKCAIALRLPEPTTSAEASAQIDALLGDIRVFAKADRARYETFGPKLQAGITGKASIDTEALVNIDGEILPNIQVITARSLRQTIERIVGQ